MKKVFGLNARFKHRSETINGNVSSIVNIDELVLHLDVENYSGSGTTLSNIGNKNFSALGSTQDATIVSSPTFLRPSNPSYPSYFSFDGYDDYLVVDSTGDSFNFRPGVSGANEITIEAWIKTSDTDDYNWISLPWNGSGDYAYRAGHNYFLMFNQYDKQLRFSSIATGNWEHIAIVVNATQWGVYRNGAVDLPMTNHNIISGYGGNASIPLTIMGLYPAMINPLFTGNTWTGGSGWGTAGQLNSLRIYRKALSAQQVAQNYNATKLKFENRNANVNTILELDASNLVSYPGSGNIWTDLSPNAFQGAIGAGATFSNDGGGSIELDGNQFVEIPDSNLFELSNFTIGVWFKRSAPWINQYWSDAIISQDENPGPYAKWYISYDQQTQKPLLSTYPSLSGADIYGSIKPSSSFVINTNVWYNLVVTKQSNVISFYGNGTLLGSTPINGSIPNPAAPLRIGYSEYNTDGSGPKPYFRGKIAKVLIHDYAKSAAQVQDDYNAIKSRFGL